MSYDYSDGSASPSWGWAAPAPSPAISVFPQIKPVTPTPPRSVPEKIDLSQITSGITGSTVSLLGQVGMAPGRITEMPVSVLDTVGKRLTGESLVDNIAKGVGSIPIVGGALQGLNDFLNTGYKWVGSMLNAATAKHLRETANLPDSAPFVGRDLERSLEASALFPVMAPIDLVANLLGGKDVLKAGMFQTVGDLRTDARARGFTDQDIADLASGARSDFSFSDPQIAQNALLDAAVRMVLDPTNLLLFTPAAAARVGTILSGGSKVVKAAALWGDAVKAKRVAEVAMDASRAAQAIEAGDTANATLKGLGIYLQRASRAGVAYRNLAVKTSVGVTAADLTSGWAQQLTSGTPLSPALEGLHAFATDILNDHPLSDNAAWSFTMAAGFPINEYLRAGKKGAQTVKARVVGESNFTNTFARRAYGDASPRGGVTRLRAAALNGQAGIDAFHDYIVTMVTRKKMAQQGRNLIVASSGKASGSFEEAAVAAHDAYAGLVVNRDALLARGEITDKDVWDMVGEWYRSGGVVGDTALRTPLERPLQTRADWQDVLNTWNAYVPLQAEVSKLYYERGLPVAMGLRSSADLPVETIQTIWETANAAKVGRKVPAAVMKQITDRWPGLGDGLDGAWWQSFVLPHANPADWPALSKRIKAAMKDPMRPTLREATGGFAAHEAAAPASPRVPEPLSNPMPTDAANLKARRAQMDGPDAAANAQLDDIYQQQIGNLATGWQRETGLTQEHLDELAALQAQLDRRAGGRYTLKPAPTAQLAVEFDPQLWGRTAAVIKERGVLASWLLDWGKSSPAARVLGWLAGPAEGGRMAAEARQAFYDAVVPKGASVESATRFWQRLQEDVRTHTLLGTRIPTVRGIEALSPVTVEDIAFGKGGVFRDNKKFQKALQQANVSLTDLIDRATSRTYRAIERGLREDHGPGRLGRALDAFYGKAEGAYEAGQQSVAGRSLKLVTREFYYLFRFVGDPRWWVMNLQEADWLGGAAEGLRGTRFSGETGRLPSQATLAHALGEGRVASKAVAAEEDILQRLPGTEYDMPILLGRRLSSRVSRMFDARRSETVNQILNSLPDSDPVIGDLVRVLGSNRETWAKQLDDWIYAADMRGVPNAVTEAAAQILTKEEAQQMSVFLTQLKTINQRTFTDITGMFYGNANRTNMERILNNYFLYWPISYQLKASKWLWGVMTERMAGKTTNALGAMKYAEIEQQHKQLMATDPEYAYIFTAHPSLWLMAQMMFPITPVDLGVSLSRPVRYAGGALGLWPVYKMADDPASAALLVTQLGPLYTGNLLNQVYGEFQPKQNYQNAMTDLYAALDTAEAAGDSAQIVAIRGMIADIWDQIDRQQQSTNVATIPPLRGPQRQPSALIAPVRQP